MMLFFRARHDCRRGAGRFLYSWTAMCSDQSVPRRCIIVLTTDWTLLLCTTLCVQLLSVAVRVLSLLCACDGSTFQN